MQKYGKPTYTMLLIYKTTVPYLQRFLSIQSFKEILKITIVR